MRQALGVYTNRAKDCLMGLVKGVHKAGGWVDLWSARLLPHLRTSYMISIV